MSIHENAMLLQLTISQWAARKLDRKASKEVNDANRADALAGRYNKRLLPPGGQLDKIHSMSGAIRSWFVANTLPWGIEGTYIKPVLGLMEFMGEFGERRREWEALVDGFVDGEYAALVLQAQRFLGDLYDPTDYPSPEHVRRKFSMDMAVLPVPTTDFRVRMSEAAVSTLRTDLERRIKESAASAMNEAWRRLHARVEHIADRLGDPEKQLRASVIENAREICSVLPQLNFADDPDLERMRQEVEGKLTVHDTDVLKASPLLRASVAGEAAEIMERMKLFMGGE